MYGYIAAEEPIQAVTFRLEATAVARRPETRAHPPSATASASATELASAMIGSRDVWLPETGALVAVAVYDRERLEPGHRLSGPAIVEQMDATTLLLPGQTAAVDPYLNLDVAS
jgi:N-methylhydantoinase A